MMTGSGIGGHAAGGPARHISVLLAEVIERLTPEDNAIYVDATFGVGGYSKAILESADCRVIAIDRDPDAIIAGQDLVSDYGDRLTLVEGKFSELRELAEQAGIKAVDGVVLDIGVSSMQLDQAERGFSFQKDGPLDMRMSRTGPSAADVVAQLDEEDLADVIFRLGEERRSRAIARAIVASRKSEPITRTGSLAGIVAGVLGTRPGTTKHPATRTFQALRLFVNNELEELVLALHGAERLLKPGGRLGVVTFHSLEDRVVKTFFTSRAGRTPRQSRHLPEKLEKGVDKMPPSFRLVNRRPVKPKEGEIHNNPRARSAKLRVAERTEAPIHPLNMEEVGLPRIRVGSVERLSGVS